MQPRIGIIGGSGLYNMDALEDRQEVAVETPWGNPSDAYITGKLAGREVAFLARHGRGHRISPSNLPFRANMYGFKKLGVETEIANDPATGAPVPRSAVAAAHEGPSLDVLR